MVPFYCLCAFFIFVIFCLSQKPMILCTIQCTLDIVLYRATSKVNCNYMHHWGCCKTRQLITYPIIYPNEWYWKQLLDRGHDFIWYRIFCYYLIYNQMNIETKTIFALPWLVKIPFKDKITLYEYKEIGQILPNFALPHLPLVPHICVSELAKHWFR